MEAEATLRHHTGQKDVRQISNSKPKDESGESRIMVIEVWLLTTPETVHVQLALLAVEPFPDIVRSIPEDPTQRLD